MFFLSEFCLELQKLVLLSDVVIFLTQLEVDLAQQATGPI